MNPVNLLIVSTTKGKWLNLYSTTNFGHSSNRCCPLQNWGVTVTQDASRSPILHRAVLTGILFILQTGLRWDLLPREMGCGSGMSCWRRLRDWQRRASGTSCTSCCLRGYVPPTKSTGLASSSTPLQSVLGSGQKRDRIPQTARDPVQSTTSSPKRRESRSP